MRALTVSLWAELRNVCAYIWIPTFTFIFTSLSVYVPSESREYLYSNPVWCQRICSSVSLSVFVTPLPQWEICISFAQSPFSESISQAFSDTTFHLPCTAFGPNDFCKERKEARSQASWLQGSDISVLRALHYRGLDLMGISGSVRLFTSKLWSRWR